jgi:S1-C subfamily serine protease
MLVSARSPLKGPIRPKFRLGRVLVLPIALLASRCASAPSLERAEVKTVAQRAPVAAKAGESSPIEFGKLVLKLPRTQLIGAVQTGRSCVGRAPLTWKTGRGSSPSEGFGELLLEELSAAGYTVVGDRETLFEDPHGSRPEYVVAGVIRDVRANVCYTNKARTRARAEASLSVDWQVYSHRTKAVELKTTTDGSSRLPNGREGATSEALSQAFLSAARNLLADAQFHDLATGITAGGPKREAPVEPIPVVYETTTAELPAAVEAMVSDSRMSVVTVFAGDAMGSGFLISRDGYLLTNQHVVGNARYVKVRFVTGRDVNGEVVRADRRRDVALIKLEADIYRPLPVGESSRVGPGADVFAIGTPLAENLGQTVTKGILSGYGEEDGLRVLRSDVSVHRGNSGGPLLDRSGSVVAMSVSGFMLMPAGVGVGLNSFIPIEDALDALGIQGTEEQ